MPISSLNAPGGPGFAKWGAGCCSPASPSRPLSSANSVSWTSCCLALGLGTSDDARTGGLSFGFCRKRFGKGRQGRTGHKLRWKHISQYEPASRLVPPPKVQLNGTRDGRAHPVNPRDAAFPNRGAFTALTVSNKTSGGFSCG